MTEQVADKVHSIYIESNVIKLLSKIIGGFFYGIGWIIGKILLAFIWLSISIIALITLGLWLSDRAPESKEIRQNARAEYHATTTCK